MDTEPKVRLRANKTMPTANIAMETSAIGDVLGRIGLVVMDLKIGDKGSENILSFPVFEASGKEKKKARTEIPNFDVFTTE